MFLSILTSIANIIIGPIVSIFNKKEDTKLEKHRINGKIDIESIHKDIEVTKAIVELNKVGKEDPTIKVGRLFFIIPTGIFYTAVVGDSVLHRYFLYDYRVEALPSNLMYIPYAVIAFLFGYVIFKGR